jgi:hypothetical protein
LIGIGDLFKVSYGFSFVLFSLSLRECKSITFFTQVNLREKINCWIITDSLKFCFYIWVGGVSGQPQPIAGSFIAPLAHQSFFPLWAWGCPFLSVTRMSKSTAISVCLYPFNALVAAKELSCS